MSFPLFFSTSFSAAVQTAPQKKERGYCAGMGCDRLPADIASPSSPERFRFSQICYLWVPPPTQSENEELQAQHLLRTGALVWLSKENPQPTLPYSPPPLLTFTPLISLCLSVKKAVANCFNLPISCEPSKPPMSPQRPRLGSPGHYDTFCEMKLSP